MRELDMAATLKRVAEIEAALDMRSKQLEATIDREIAKLGDALIHQVTKHLDALPGQLGPNVAAAFDKQFDSTKRAIDALVTDTGARHSELLATIRLGLEQHAAEAKARDAALTQSIAQLATLVRNASDSYTAALAKAIADSDAKSGSRAKEIEAAVAAGTQRAARLAAVAATLAAAAMIAAVVCIFV
jgi:hypothetical protein